MSMKLLTILQIAGILAAYLSVTMVAPWILLRKRLADLKLSVRWMAYFLCGNFYIINMVTLLQLMHISYRPTLIIGTLIPFVAAAVIRWRKKFTLALEQGTRRLRLISEGELGLKTQLYWIREKLQEISSGLLGEWMSLHFGDIILTLGMIILVFYVYGVSAVNVYGYGASDIEVHNAWINELGNNHIYAAGIYPYGFHVVIYYLHKVFVIPTYVLLRVFCVVQTLMIHFMLLLFLRAVCKSKYAPYIGTFIFAAADIFSPDAYIRYYSSLPQEFGMVFILPSVYFAIAFLQERGFVSDEGKKKGVRLPFSLVMFAAGISMMLAVHFYDAVTAAFFCVGLAIGYCFRCFRWRYLKKLILAGIIGIMLAAAPMGAAYIMGAPLQDSLYWGMSVMSNEGEDDQMEDAQVEDVREEGSEAPVSAGSSLLEMLHKIQNQIRIYVAKENAAAAWCILGSTAMLLVLGIIWLILKRKDYGGLLISVSVFMMILFLFQNAADLGLPHLIAIPRCSIYIVYG